MKKKKAATIGLLVGTAKNAKRAASVARFFSTCPYCAGVTHTGNLVLAVLSFPASHKWWFESMAKDPSHTVGLQTVQALYPKHSHATSPWSSGLIECLQKKTPCGAECRKCPEYQNRCEGCPAIAVRPR